MVIQRVWRSQQQASLGATTAPVGSSTTSGTTGTTASPPAATSQSSAATSVSDALDHETSGNGSTNNHSNSTLGSLASQGMRQVTIPSKASTMVYDIDFLIFPVTEAAQKYALR